HSSSPALVLNLDPAHSLMLEIRARISAAAASGGQRLSALWEELERASPANTDVAVLVAESFIGLGRPARALGALARAGSGVRAEQLRALALAKSGDVDRAIEALTRLQQS